MGSTTIGRGRSSAEGYKPLTKRSAIGEYNEAKRLATIKDPEHRHIVRCLRAGLVKSKCELTKGYAEGEGQPYRQSRRAGTTVSASLWCTCGAEFQDSYHMIWECRDTLQRKHDLQHRLRNELRGTDMGSALQTCTAHNTLEAALGGRRERRSGGYVQDTTLMELAAPSVAAVYGDIVSVPFSHPC